MALTDLGNIHHKYGFTGQALNMWEKSYEASSSDEDQKKMCLVIMRAAVSSQNLFYLNRFCEKARYHLNQNFPQFSQTVAVMQALCNLLEEQPLKAVQHLYQCNVSMLIDDNPDLNQFLSGQDLSFYIVLSALGHMHRIEIKNNLLTCSSVLSLLECYPETADIFDNFLNGRFHKLQSSLS